MAEDEIVGITDRIREIRSLLSQIGSTQATVLISGETGTGKELLAHRLHAASPRANSAFLKLNCAALPSELVEVEMFGYERGAFAGAFEKKAGMFETAEGGTILLDEIGDMDVRLQAKLLQLLQDGEFRRMGGKEAIRADVRVIATTHRDLEQLIVNGKFREDLYYRLAVITIALPALRERRDDVPLLAQHFLRMFGKQYNKVIETVPDKTVSALMKYTWPGNVRELRDFIERAVVRSDGPILEASFDQLESLSTTGVSGAGTLTNDIISLVIDPLLTPEQIISTLTALANYFRACGGVGLTIEFESQEAVTEHIYV